MAVDGRNRELHDLPYHAELEAQTARLRAREAELEEARRRHVAAREGYKARRAEFSRARWPAPPGSGR